MKQKSNKYLAVFFCLAIVAAIAPSLARAWSEDEFDHRPLFA